MSDTDQTEPLQGWGLVPAPVVTAVHLLNDHVLRHGQRLDRKVWPKMPRDVQDLLEFAIGGADAVERAAADLRALLTAYAHRFHRPRPVLAELARAQGITPQGLTRRYNTAHVIAIENLLSATPDVLRISEGFPSLRLQDLALFEGPVGEAARKEAARQFEELYPER